MHRFTVWAPDAARVELLLGDDRHPMAPEQPVAPERPGWWVCDVEEAGPGTDYRFSIDGGPGRPDPRSPHQPDGIDGPSRVVDRAEFGWTDDRWRGIHLPSAVLYELHVGTFTEAGTFDAAAERLPHLAALGIDAIELLPVAEASGERGWGYDGVDWFAPHHAYGGPDGMKRFVDAAHGAGIGVLMDVVYNHLGPAGNYLAEFGPYFTDHYRTNWGDAVNFGGAFSDEVRRFVLDNARMWLADYHCDGLRLDAVHAIYDDSAVHVLEELAGAVRKLSADLGRPLWLVAESDLNDPRFVRDPAAGGFGLGSAWADEFHHALHAALTGERSGYYEDFGSLSHVATALERAWVYAGDWSPHRRRTHGRSPVGLTADRFVVFTQNHDQVGNRAAGERLCELAGFERAKIAAALLFCSPFVPLVFQGEEWGASSPFQYFTDHRDPELGRAVSEGRRGEFSAFGWAPEDVPDPQAKSTFERSKLDWGELEAPAHAEMLEWYRGLIELRRRTPGLVASELDAVSVSFDEEDGWLVVDRPGLVLAVNLGATPVKLEIDVAQLVVALSSTDDLSVHDACIVLPPDSVAVLTPLAGAGRPTLPVAMKEGTP